MPIHAELGSGELGEILEKDLGRPAPLGGRTTLIVHLQLPGAEMQVLGWAGELAFLTFLGNARTAGRGTTL